MKMADMMLAENSDDENANSKMAATHQVVSEGLEELQRLAMLIGKVQYHIKECSDKGTYRAAGELKNKEAKLKEQLKRREFEHLKLVQKSEVVAIYAARDDELAAFKTHWDSMFQDFHMHSKDLNNKLKQRQLLDRKEYHEQMSAPKFFRASKKLLAGRQKQGQENKSWEFDQAFKTMNEYDIIEAEELQAHLDHCKVEVDRKMKIFEEKHKLEEKGLDHRIRAGRFELESAKNAEFERLNSRLKNVLRRMKNQHKQAQNQLHAMGSSVTSFLSLSGANNAQGNTDTYLDPTSAIGKEW